ncbi:MAG: hypothetical protein ABWX66_00795 [Lacisediminihabitans sp.]
MTSPNWDNWDAVLTAMETYLQRAVVDDVDEPEADEPEIDEPEIGARVWALPGDLGPLPVALRERAERVLDAQQQGVAELESRQRTVARHLAALRTVPGSTGGGSSPYLDVTG